jgi:hypothetical protein
LFFEKKFKKVLWLLQVFAKQTEIEDRSKLQKAVEKTELSTRPSFSSSSESGLDRGIVP